MNCSRNLLALGAMFLLAVSPTLRAEDATAKGVNYLISKQADDGSWNSEDKLKLVDSSESFLALTRTTGGENSLNKSLQFFSALTDENNETLAFKLIALSSSTATIDTLVTQLGNMQKSDGGWGLADVQKGSIPYTITVMNALLKSGKSTNTILSKGAEFLVKQQDANGAWIFTSEHSLSDTAHTAMALIILKKVQNDNIFSGSGLEQAIQKAQQYLESKNNSGSYGNIVDSAWAYLALCRIKQPSEMSATLTLIQNSQLDNGSWSDTIYDTAVCLQALTAIQVPQTDLPDLEILEKNITFSPTAPLTGNEVTISATIFNNGELDAENVKIEFFNRDPRLDGVEIAPAQTVNLIPAGGSIQVSAKFVSTGMVGPVQIVIFVDRENTIREVSKANNAAAKIISVGGMPDLSIASSDITLSNPNPAPFETVDLTVVIHNIGNEAVANIPVKIFDNDKLFYEFIMSGVNAESSNKAIITTGFSAETHNIRVEVDPDHTITNEINLANNTASTSFTIDKDAEKPLDIAVESIVFDPAAPLSTSPTKITVTIANLGGIDATTAFNTTLSVDGTVIGTISVPQLLGGQKAVLNFNNITLAAGDRTVTAVADSGNVVTADTNRANNTMSTTIAVRDSATPVDLNVVSFTATPTTATVGGTVVFKVTLKNNGTTTAESVVVKLFNGTTALGSGITLPRLVGGQSADLQFEHSFSTNGSYTIRAVADPDNKITESDKTNNEKSVTVTVAGASDLEITSANILLSNTAPVAFQRIEIIAVVKNIGNMDATNVPVRFLANGEVLATMNLSGVSAGGSNKATLSTTLPKGTYNIVVQIDPDKTLTSEHNYTNNSAYRELTVTAPVTTQADLAVEKLVIDPALPIQGTATNLTATIINAGGTDIVTPFSVEFKDGATVLHTFTVSSLAAGQKAELKLSANLTAGDHTITVTADSGNVIVESTKENNSTTKQLTVASNATPADLSVTVTMDKASPNVMDKVTFTAAIYNGGTTVAENFYVKIMINGVAFGDEYLVTSLKGGSTFNLQIPYTVASESTTTIQVTADSRNTVTESDKTNNTGSLSFTAGTIPRPDLTIPSGGINTNPERPQPGANFEYKITVANIGNAAAEACKLLITEGHPQMAGAVKLAEVDIPALAAGANAVVSAKLKFDTNKENIYIFVDANDDIAESNEDNNLFKTSIAVEALPDLYIEDSAISFSHSNLDNGTMVTISFKIDNIGNVDAKAFKVNVLERSNEQYFAIGEKSVELLKSKESLDISVTWLATTGSKEIVVIIDNENKVVEITKNNNTASKSQEFTRSGVGVKLYLASNGQMDEKYSYNPYETIKIIPQVHFSGAQYMVSVVDPQSSVYYAREEAGEFYYSTDHNASGTYKVLLDVFDEEGYYIDSTEKEFTLGEQFKLGDIIIRATPTMIRANELKPVDLTFIVQNRSNIDGNGSLQIKIKDPSGKYIYDETTSNISFESGKQKIITLDPLTEVFVTDGRYVIEAIIKTADGEQQLTAATRNFDVLPANSVKVTKTLSPLTLDPLGEGKVHVKIDVEGVGTHTDIAPLDLILVIDVSGSMGGEPIEQCKEAANLFIDMLPANARAALVVFEDWGRLITPLSFDRTQIKSDISSLGAGGGTAIGDGMRAARVHFEEASVGRKRIEIVLSDGESDYWQIQEEIDFAKNLSIEVHSIGLGYYTMEYIMEEIALGTGGQYFFSPEPADLRNVFKEVFEAAVSAAANNVKITDVFNTDKITIISGTLSPDPASINNETGEIIWTKDKMTIDDKFSYEFDVLLTDLIPGETRVVNKILNLDFLTPDGTQELNIEIGEQSVSVGELAAITIKTDKDQYLASEDVNMKVDLVLKGNKIQKYSTKDTWGAGTLQNVDIESKPGILRTTTFRVSEPENIVKNGGFETGNFENWVTKNYLGITDHRYEGNYSAYMYMYNNPSIYQDILIPANASSAALSFVTYLEDWWYASVRVEVRDTDNNLLKELVRISGWHDWTTRQFDLSEFIGQRIRLVFKASGDGYFYMDNVVLNVVKTTYQPVATANYVIDTNNISILDKMTSDQKLSEGNAIKFRVRGSDSVSGLSQATWSEYLTGTDIQLPELITRYFELEVTLEATENAASPELSNLKLSYISYTSEDNLHAVVDVKDADGSVLRTYNNLRPNLQLGREQTFNLVWNTGTNLPGPYTANAVLYVREIKACSDKDNFEIIEGQLAEILDGSIATDKQEYAGGDAVQISSRVNNKSQNSSVNSLNVNVKILNSSNEVVFTSDYVISALLAQSLNTKALSFTVANDLPLGEYTVVQTVKTGDDEAFTRQAKFSVITSAEQGKGITGTLVPQPLIVKRRIGDLTFLATGKNTGNIDLTNVTFKVTIYDPTTLDAIKVIEKTAATLAKDGAGYSEQHPYGAKVELMPGVYPATLTAEFTHDGKKYSIPLDTTGFTVTNTPPVANAGSDITASTSTQAGAKVTLNGSASTDENSTDAALKNDIVKYEWKKGDTVLGEGETLEVEFASGEHTVTLTVTDTCGATHSVTIKVTVDQTVKPPTITDLNPAHNTITRELGLSAKAADAIWGVDWTTLVFKSGATTLTASYDEETGKITSSLPADSPDGWYDLNITVKNKGGAEATTTEWRVGLDRTPPTITNMLPANNAEINSASQEISAIVADAMSGINADTIVLKLNDNAVAHTYDAATGKVSFNATDLASGTYTVSITVNDKVGNSANASWNFKVQLQVAGGDYLLFHNSKNGELSITGGNKNINGLAHSNAAIKIRGNNTTISGKTTAVSDISINGNSHDVALQQANAPQIAMPVYPYEYYVANATQVHNGSLTIDKDSVLQPGIHLVNGDVTIKGDISASITIVATGDIKVTSQVVNLTTADTKYRVALYSLKGDIDFSSNGVTVNGIVYAPSGTISVQSNNSTFTGGIIADQVKFAGQNLTLNPFKNN